MKQKIILTPEQEDYILENYEQKTAKEIGARLGISHGYVSKYLASMGLRSPRYNATESLPIEIDLNGMFDESVYNKIYGWS